MMLFNKLQSITLLSLLFLFNVRPYDFAEDVGEFIENAEGISGEMAAVFESAVEEGKMAAVHVQEIGETLTEALGESLTEGFVESLAETVGESLSASIKETFNQVELRATDAQDIERMINNEFEREVKTKEIENITRKQISGLPKWKKLLNPKIIGTIVAIIIVVAVVVKFYLGRKKMPQELEIETKKQVMRKKALDLAACFNMDHVIEESKEMAKVLKSAQEKVGVDMPELSELFQTMSERKPLDKFVEGYDYCAPLREVISKGEHTGIDLDVRAALESYDAKWVTLVTKYNKCYDIRQKASMWSELLTASDADILKMDLDTPVGDLSEMYNKK